MNNARRAQLRKALVLIAQARDIVSECQSDEQDYYDNMPEGIQAGEKGEAAQTAADALETAAGSLEEVESEIETAIEGA